MEWKLKEFLDHSPSQYHAVENVRKQLLAEGYTQLTENKAWQLQPGKGYFVVRGGSALIAFRIPESTPSGFMMSAAHSDRPTFKVKENGELTGTYTRLATEKYGGVIISTWLDRPLSIAGRVFVETEEGMESRLVNIDKDLLMIPNVAIHMNRKVNEGYAWNPAVDTLPLVGGKEAAGKLQTVLEEAAGGKIISHDLYLYLREEARIWGIDGEFISAQAIDDLACVFGCAQGFMQAKPADNVPVLCIFDGEEVGSATVQGADSRLLESVLGRICQSCGWDLESLVSQSVMISADNGHAIHPNHPEYSDATNAPVVNGGVTLKFNATQKYTTDGITAGVFKTVCKKAGVKVQTYYNRADVPGGSTLGNISLSHISVPTADIGLPQLAMHSAMETAGVKDVRDLVVAMTAYYESALETDGVGSYRIR